MKHLYLVVGLLLTTSMSFAQTDEMNLQKYWKLRNTLREDFTRIGGDPGESLPARSLKPLDCVDNDFGYTDGTSPYVPQTPLGRYGHGEVNYGDGMIRHGYYLGLLATEYRLLKDAGEDVSGTLNELYFALKAINRLDFSAEEVLDGIYNADFDESLNGFYLREDIPENFAFDNWGNSNLEARCVNSPMYKTNNAMHINSGGFFAEANSYQNVPSLDQLSSLMLGFSLIHKLVDDVYVLPQGEPENSGFAIVTETKAIVNRIMTYIEDHNWMMIDVNGWPVANQGGDCLAVSYPLYEAAKRITGNSYIAPAYRNQVAFHAADIQYCITGFGIDENTAEGQEEACDEINFWEPAQINAYNYLLPGAPAGVLNNASTSVYQGWLLNSYDIVVVPNSVQMQTIWTTESVQGFIDHVTTIMNVNAYSLTLLSNIGVASGVWGNSRLHAFIQNTGNKELYLINAVLRGETPYHSQTTYKGLLDGMSSTGPFNLITEMEGSTGLKKTASNGWGSDLRWTQDDEIYGSFGEAGIFNGIDYMLFHNLYYLIYKNNLPKFTTQQECFCENIAPLTGTSDPAYPGVTEANYVAARDRINTKLTFLSSCVDDAFESVSNNVMGIINLQPYFSEYISYQIFPAKFMKTDATIAGTGTVNAQTFFKICNGRTLTIQAGGKLDIQQSRTEVGITAAIDNAGTITVRSGKTLSVFGVLTLRNTGKLIIENGATVTIELGPTGQLRYYNGAQIIMNGPDSKLIIRGLISIKDLADFKVIQNGTSCGQIIIDSPTVGLSSDNSNATYTFTGSGKTVPYMTITKNSKLWITNEFAKSLTFTNANVVFQEGASIRCDQPFNVYNSTLSSSVNNNGILLSEGSYFNGTDLLNIPVFSDFTLENTGIMETYNCTFKTNLTTLTAPYVVKVTGRGYKIRKTDIQGVKDYCIYSNNMSIASLVEEASIGYNGTLPTGNNVTGIFDYSTAEVTLKTSGVRNCHLGIHKRNGKLTVRCSTLELNRDVNIRPQDGCILNMNTTQLGGYNKLLKTTNNKNIYLSSAGFMNLKDGYNYIDYVANQTIYGSVNSYCSSCPTHDVTKNQWPGSSGTPAIGTVSSWVPGVTISWVITPTANWQACSSGSPGGIQLGKSTDGEIPLPTIYSEVEEDSIRLDDAIYSAISYMSYYNDSTASDLRAIARLSEVFKGDLDKADSSVNAWLWFAFDQMKVAIESAYASNLITLSDNIGQFEDNTLKFVNALMYMTDDVITPDNYSKQFHHEINKAHLLRLTGNVAIGLGILEELETCGLDSLQQTQLNYWKSIYMAELIIQETNVSTFDTLVTVDTTEFLDPAEVVNGYSFGAIINDLSSIIYPNCDLYYARGLAAVHGSKQFAIHPNPASESVLLAVTSDVAGLGYLYVTSSDGRKIYSQSIDIANDCKYSIDLSNWNSGVYLVTLVYADEKQITKRLVVK